MATTTDQGSHKNLIEEIITSIGRHPAPRNTLYGTISELQREKSFAAAELSPLVQTAAKKYARAGSAALSSTMSS